MDGENTKKIEVDESTLKKIVEQNAAMASELAALRNDVDAQGAHPGVTLKKVLERTVRVTFVDGHAVIGFVNKGSETQKIYVVAEPDPNDRNKELLFVELILQGVDAPVRVNYNNFLKQAERRACKVKDVKKSVWTIDQGTVRQKVMDGFSLVETDLIVPLEVTGETRTYEVEIAPGTNLLINEAYVNM